MILRTSSRIRVTCSSAYRAVPGADSHVATLRPIVSTDTFGRHECQSERGAPAQRAHLQLELELAALLHQARQADQLDVPVRQELLPLLAAQPQQILHPAMHSEGCMAGSTACGLLKSERVQIPRESAKVGLL